MNIFLLFGDKKKKTNELKGGCKEINHIDWLECTSITQVIERVHPPGYPPGQFDINRYNPVRLSYSERKNLGNHGAVEIIRSVDQASPKLMEYVSIGKSFAKVHIEFTRLDKEKVSVPSFEWIFDNSVIISYRLSAAEEANSKAFTTEIIQLNYDNIKWIYSKTDDKGNPDGSIEGSCDLKAQ